MKSSIKFIIIQLIFLKLFILDKSLKLEHSK